MVHFLFTLFKGSKRLLAQLEGHDNPKALHPWTQFLAAGLGGMISQLVKLLPPLHSLTRTQVRHIST